MHIFLAYKYYIITGVIVVCLLAVGIFFLVNANVGDENANIPTPPLPSMPVSTPTIEYDIFGQCSTFCEESMVGDGHCDMFCNNEECNYDNMDCGWR